MIKVGDRIRKMVSHLGRIEQSLGGLIDEDMAPMRRMQDFAPDHNMAKIDSLRQPDDALSSPWQILDQVVENLAPHCRSALGLSRRGSQWHCVCLAHLGEFFPIPIEEAEPLGVPLAGQAVDTVAVAQAQKFLLRAGWASLVRSADDRAYLFQPDEAQAIVVITDIASLWEADYVSKLQTLLRQAFQVQGKP